MKEESERFDRPTRVEAIHDARRATPVVREVHGALIVLLTRPPLISVNTVPPVCRVERETTRRDTTQWITAEKRLRPRVHGWRTGSRPFRVQRNAWRAIGKQDVHTNQNRREPMVSVRGSTTKRRDVECRGRNNRYQAKENRRVVARLGVYQIYALLGSVACG